MARIQAERCEIKLNPASLPVKRIQIANHDDHVGKIAARFAVADHLRIVGVVKMEIGITLECRIFAADPIDPRDEPFQTGGGIQIPVLDRKSVV